MEAMLSFMKSVGKGKDNSPSPPTRLEAFLSTLVLYPAFYMLATTPASEQAGRQHRFSRPVAESARRLIAQHVRVGRKGARVSAAGDGEGGQGAALAPEVHAEFTGFPEAQALVTLERWCQEPAFLSSATLYGTRLRDYLESLQAWQRVGSQQTYVRAGLQLLLSLSSTALDRLLPPRPPVLTLPDLVALQQQQQQKTRHTGSSGKVPEPTRPVAGSSSGNTGTAPAAAMQHAPPEQQASDQAAVQDAPNPIAQVAKAIAPNMHFIQDSVLTPTSMSRGRTWFEFLQVLLSVARVCLYWLAYVFFWVATLMRLGGNGLSALGGLFAFTVVVSVILSVLSALVFVSASGADAIGSCIIYMARFTDIARRKSTTMREMSAAGMQGPDEDSKLGPRKLPLSTFEQLDGFLMHQLAASALRRPQRLQSERFATPVSALRSRPDIPRLAHDPLLVHCYDLQFIDAAGNLLRETGPEEVMQHFDQSGFFAFANKNTRRVAAVFVLRLLAWRRVSIILNPPGSSAESEEALRYVFVSGLPGSGAGAVYQLLTGMAIDNKKPCHQSQTEIRSVMHHPTSFAVLACPHGPEQNGEQGTPVSSWVTDLSHGIVSCLVFTLPADSLGPHHLSAPTPPGSGNTAAQGPPQAPPKHPSATPSSTTSSKGTQQGRQVLEEEGAVRNAAQRPDQHSDQGAEKGSGKAGQGAEEAEQQQQQQQQEVRKQGVVSARLAQVWRALELHRPVLVLVQKSGAAAEGQEDTQLEHVIEASRQLSMLLVEEVNARGLNSQDLTVAPAALCEQPPVGFSGSSQVKSWVSHALAGARQQR